MRVLLDEDVPEQVINILRHILRGHEVTHVHEQGWTGKKDLQLFKDIVGKFDAILTNNYHQLDDPDETSQIKKSRVHHISYEQKGAGLRGLALAVAAIVAAMPDLISDLSEAESQRLVSISSIAPDRRYTITDPRRDPPKYWPR